MGDPDPKCALPLRRNWGFRRGLGVILFALAVGMMVLSIHNWFLFLQLIDRRPDMFTYADTKDLQWRAVSALVSPMVVSVVWLAISMVMIYKSFKRH